MSLAVAQINILSTQTSNSAEPEPATQILSDTLVYDDAKKTSRFTGSVVMTRGLFTLSADALDLREDNDGFQFGIATMDEGKRVNIRQEQPKEYKLLEGIGERAEYDGKAETFDLIGKARVTRYICGNPFDTISGERVRYNQKTDTYRAFGGTNSDTADGRVRSVAQPRAKVDAAIEACRVLHAQGQLPAGVPAPEKP
jgi:lipopolysaccharide export system protein LptA